MTRKEIYFQRSSTSSRPVFEGWPDGRHRLPAVSLLIAGLRQVCQSACNHLACKTWPHCARTQADGIAIFRCRWHRARVDVPRGAWPRATAWSHVTRRNGLKKRSQIRKRERWRLAEFKVASKQLQAKRHKSSRDEKTPSELLRGRRRHAGEQKKPGLGLTSLTGKGGEAGSAKQVGEVAPPTCAKDAKAESRFRKRIEWDVGCERYRYLVPPPLPWPANLALSHKLARHQAHEPVNQPWSLFFPSSCLFAQLQGPAAVNTSDACARRTRCAAAAAETCLAS